MITINNILCPVDYSIYSEKALAYAIELATRFQAKLHLLHVLDIRFLDVNNPELPYIPVTANIISEETIAMLKSRLLKSVSDETQGKISVEAIVIQGVPFTEIIRTARESNIDLIVIGTHGRTGLAHAVMGSVAEKVVRKAPCPVLTIRHPEHDFVTP
ncbi:MAG: hypothetical protein A2W17_08550 [Planctomycetes bacterium RBG_16_41_13]|nr:MAG: hypothetical protein A2W17_08550 [Planctomycetes bacterium RBG_16_41_13]